ncbi:MAG: hypothetical protein JRJ26_15995 [Deltaproteobacteria bacterium]|nr:hypothetical protein [Deltaproteobacteria bacterium]
MREGAWSWIKSVFVDKDRVRDSCTCSWIKIVIRVRGACSWEKIVGRVRGKRSWGVFVRRVRVVKREAWTGLQRRGGFA